MTYDFDPVEGKSRGSDEKTNKATKNISSFAFSSKFLSKGIKEYIKKSTGFEIKEDNADNCIKKLSIEGIGNKIAKVSKIYKDITTVPGLSLLPKAKHKISIKKQGEITVLDEDCIGDIIWKIIYNSYDLHSHKPEDLLIIQSPIGSYKNRLLQYVFLKLNKEAKFPIFYIDVSKYEYLDDKSALINLIEGDLSIIKNILKRHYFVPEQKRQSIKRNLKPPKGLENNRAAPLFILDNVREFNCGVNDGYEKIKKFLNSLNTNDEGELLSELNCGYKLVIGSDVCYTINNTNKSMPFFEKLETKDAHIFYKVKNALSITSMNLNRHKESVDFINNCISFFKDDSSYKGIKKNIDGEIIREKLITKEFYTLDAYWLLNVLSKTSALTENIETILKIYDEAIFYYSSSMGKSQYDTLASSVYRFEYDVENFDPEELHVSHWKIAREHRSVVDYLVARHYIILLKAPINLTDEVQIRKNICSCLLNLIFPKSINRFIIWQFTSNDINMLITFCEKFNSIIKDYVNFQCQIAYLLGVRQTSGLSTRAVNILSRMKEDLNTTYTNLKETDRRHYVFALRCVNVSLGRLGDTENFQEYLVSILPQNYSSVFRDEAADDINRAFHLNYYGDCNVGLKPSENFGNFKDDKQKGVNTFRKLLLDCESKLKKYNSLSLGEKNILLLQFYTYCRLLEVRNYQFLQPTKDEDFVNGLYKILEQFLIELNKDKDFRSKISGCIISYFKDFNEVLNGRLQIENPNKMFNKLNGLSKIKRTGWKIRGIPEPESVSDHSLSCCGMALLYLPADNSDTNFNEEFKGSYDRELIINLLMIHDFGEIDIGDIKRGLKTKEQKEREASSIAEFLAIAYAGSDKGAEILKFWKDMESGNPQNINSKIAKEIDYIQGAYQYFTYCVEKKAMPGDASCREWLNEVNNKNIKTKLGREIRRRSIIHNELFLNDKVLGSLISKHVTLMKINV